MTLISENAPYSNGVRPVIGASLALIESTIWTIGGGGYDINGATAQSYPQTFSTSLSDLKNPILGPNIPNQLTYPLLSISSNNTIQLFVANSSDQCELLESFKNVKGWRTVHSTTPKIPNEPCMDHTATQGNSVWAFGGSHSFDTFLDTNILVKVTASTNDIDVDQIRPQTPNTIWPQARSSGILLKLNDTHLILNGGSSGNNVFGDWWMYSIPTGKWFRGTSQLKAPRHSHRGVIGTHILQSTLFSSKQVSGGWSNVPDVPFMEMIDTTTGTSIPLDIPAQNNADKPGFLSLHNMIFVNDNILLLNGLASNTNNQHNKNSFVVSVRDQSDAGKAANTPFDFAWEDKFVSKPSATTDISPNPTYTATPTSSIIPVISADEQQSFWSQYGIWMTVAAAILAGLIAIVLLCCFLRRRRQWSSNQSDQPTNLNTQQILPMYTTAKLNSLSRLDSVLQQANVSIDSSVEISGDENVNVVTNSAETIHGAAIAISAVKANTLARLNTSFHTINQSSSDHGSSLILPVGTTNTSNVASAGTGTLMKMNTDVNPDTNLYLSKLSIEMGAYASGQISSAGSITTAHSSETCPNITSNLFPHTTFDTSLQSTKPLAATHVQGSGIIPSTITSAPSHTPPGINPNITTKLALLTRLSASLQAANNHHITSNASTMVQNGAKILPPGTALTVNNYHSVSQSNAYTKPAIIVKPNSSVHFGKPPINMSAPNSSNVSGTSVTTTYHVTGVNTNVVANSNSVMTASIHSTKPSIAMTPQGSGTKSSEASVTVTHVLETDTGSYTTPNANINPVKPPISASAQGSSGITAAESTIANYVTNSKTIKPELVNKMGTIRTGIISGAAAASVAYDLEADPESGIKPEADATHNTSPGVVGNTGTITTNHITETNVNVLGWVTKFGAKLRPGNHSGAISAHATGAIYAHSTGASTHSNASGTSANNTITYAQESTTNSLTGPTTSMVGYASNKAHSGEEKLTKPQKSVKKTKILTTATPGASRPLSSSSSSTSSLSSSRSSSSSSSNSSSSSGRSSRCRSSSSSSNSSNPSNGSYSSKSTNNKTKGIILATSMVSEELSKIEQNLGKGKQMLTTLK